MSADLLPAVRRLARLLTDLLFPPRCVACAQPGPLLCPACLAGIPRFAAPRCPRCDLPRRADPCPTCRFGPAGLAGMRVVGPHAEPLRGAIHELKYRGRSALAAPLGSLLAERWQEATAPPLSGVLPVPLHPARLATRGFNQSELLAQPLAAQLGLPLRPDLLQRTRDTVPQVGLDRRARQANVNRAFQASPEVAGGCWLLVDDVCTTGATLAASAAALRAEGARSVWAITLARAHRERRAR